ncbi:hypothetical protein ACFOWM_10005 [Ferruginibacter yonginensis]|uniref:Uncharacterized protein n=1 Tax=Ferruginibacter yonginensis TaxID=1310416 RepID=A0ABV8QSD2_9BACT
MNNELIHIVNNQFEITANDNDWMDLLATKINWLIVHQFNKLIAILYRADISETKLQQLLSQHPHEDAGKIIAALYVERQRQKQQSRQQYRRDVNDIDENERW